MPLPEPMPMPRPRATLEEEKRVIPPRITVSPAKLPRSDESAEPALDLIKVSKVEGSSPPKRAPPPPPAKKLGMVKRTLS